MSLPLFKKVGLLWLVFLIGLSGLWNNSSLVQQAHAAAAQPYLGEIKLFPYRSAPQGWLPADGRLLSLTQNTALYSLIGNNYGGDGKSNFALPDLTNAAPEGLRYFVATNGIFPPRDTDSPYNENAVLGEIRLFPYVFSPTGWLTANGQSLNTSTYLDLYKMLGTTYGTDNLNEFKLPTLPDINGVHYAIFAHSTRHAEFGTGNEYAGEIIPMLVTLPTNNWTLADGSALPINQNEVLFSLLSTRFGGNGITDFKVPNLNNSQSILVYYVATAGIFPNLSDDPFPVAVADNYTTLQNTILTISSPGLLANDSYAITASLKTAPMNGTIVLNANGSFTYTPNINFTGTDSFYYYASSNQSGTIDSALVTITVEPNSKPTVSGVTNGGYYNQTVTPTFDSGTALLNGAAFTSGTAVMADGSYTLVVTNDIGSTTVQFNIDTAAPVVLGVADNGKYDKGPTITFNEGTATLNGSPFSSGATVQSEGEYILIVTDSAGNTTNLHFSFYVPRTINFNSNGGSEVNEQTVYYGDKVIIPSDPTKAGHTFTGWYTNSALNQAFDFSNTTVTNDLTLFAKWTVNTYTMNFESNGGSVIADQSVDYGGLATAPTDPTKVGHTFAGWYTDSALNQAFDFDNTTVTHNLTLYAKWTPNTYKVTFNTLGGSAVSDAAVEYGKKLSAPASPSRSGYTFAGWYADPELKTSFNFDQTEVTADLTLYAKWSVNSTPPSGGNDGNSSGGGSDNQNNNGPSSPPSQPDTITHSSTNGRLTLAAGQAGQVSLGDAITVNIPAGAMNQELKITIDQIADPSALLTNQIPLSSIYELLKNVPQNFSVPVTLTLTFDSSSLQSNQRAELFYFDEQGKVWRSAGKSSVNGKQIRVDVNHFTKFAVLAVEQPKEPIEISFKDVEGHWAKEVIQQAIRKGIVKGYADGSFKPDASITRAEFTVMLMNTLHTEYTEATLSFTDRSKIGAWAQSAVARALQAGFIQGDSNGAFRPNEAVTRAEMAVMISSALQLKVESSAHSTFADDEQIPSWARVAVAGLQKSGLLNGKGLNNFAPRDNTTRAEAVKLLLSMPK
ncbi:InlB B-repeat-containing protein [Paenibacillus taichungensis]|uniref:InlB B-repeat-containing protein n=1 Tax=Paenibacillus taichungensis TaxID=484184 RepID=UPI002DBFCDA0|nr:InlB B-repeat-containing protein [Paenibacillus taichungensis]MEC0109726.1 InlB B-repeat-containing protein [Paenibacillus taichungensis]MEC0199026.1 InlB B-repeat-containing protein [Paenibacillus taichungensis]